MRFARLIAYVVLAYAVIAALGTGAAEAHPMSTTAILLDAGSERVTGEVELPIDRLEVALGETLTASSVLEPAKLEELRRYVLGHTSAATWSVGLTGGRVEKVDSVDHLIFDLTLTPSGEKSDNLRLTYDAILEKIVSHQIFVAVRSGNSYTTVGILDWRQHTVTVPVATEAAAGAGFLPSIRLGIRHIASGADHLLFLIMLLLPAPLAARRGRWVRGDDLRRDCVRVVHVVTAFAIGHSITLALGALGYVSAPTRVVECLIALSILVSAVHAIRPLTRGGEVWIAVLFGLMHGLAFAALIGDLGLGRGSLVTDLLGFNLGIELTQLAVVALLMPSLLVLSRTLLYPVVRIGLAGAGLVLAAAWLAERATLIAADPLEPVSAYLVAHPFPVAAALALVAVTARAVPRLAIGSDRRVLVRQQA